MELKEKIDSQVAVLSDLVNEIKTLDSIIEKTEEITEKTQYLEYLLDTIEDYKTICNDLRVDLNTYFDYEQNNQVPVEFSFHRLAKALDSIKV